MAEKNPKMSKKEKKIIKNSSAKDYIETSVYGIGLSKFDKDYKNITDLTNSIKSKIHTKNEALNKNITRIGQMINEFNGNSNRMQITELKEISHTKSGIRTIGDMVSNTNSDELGTIDLFEQNIKNSFMQMNEFKIIKKIVPELYKIVKNMTRDILNNNDMKRKFIVTIFKDADTHEGDSVNISDINKEVIEKVVTRNDLERKIKKYVEAALLTGAQPVAVIPYSDIREMLSERLEKSSESLESYYENMEKNTNFYKSSISERYFNGIKFSYESVGNKYTVTGEDDSNINDDNIYDYILKDAVDEYFSLESDLYLKNIDYTNEDDNDDKFRKLLEKGDENVIKLKKQEIKKELIHLIDMVDRNIEIVDHTRSAISLAKQTLKQSWKFRYLNEKSMDINVNPTINKKSNDEKGTKIEKYTPEMGDYGDNFIKTNTKNKKEDKKNDDGLDDVLILEFDPENVIPIIINGVHVDYYVIEDEAYDSGIGRNRKFSFSFLDIIKSLGVGEDDAVTNGLNGLGPTGNSYNNVPMFGQGINIGSFTSSINSNVQTEDSIRRNEILKNIIFRTISTKMDNIDMVDNKIFRDCIMNLFRQGYILKKKVKFTNIPASNMVYFAHDLSNNGLPSSIYSDTLFYCYIYIMSLVSSLLIKLAKSSYKDKVKFDVAEGNNVGVAIQQIDHVLSTRQTHGFETFNGIFNVLKNSIAHDRIIIPTIDGNSFFDYEQMENINDINIDDDFTEKMLYKIIQQTSYPAAAMNKLSEEEYSRSIATQQLFYANDLSEKQEIFASQVTKLLKLCIKYTSFSKTTQDFSKKYLDTIDFSFTIPIELSLQNNTELFSSIEGFTDMLTKIYWGNEAEEDELKESVNKFKKEVIQVLCTNIDWKGYDTIFEKALSSQALNKLKKLKHQKLNEEIENNAMPEDDDSSFDSGGSDMGGGDFGDIGGDDAGGGDDIGMGDFGDIGGGDGGAEEENEEIQY